MSVNSDELLDRLLHLGSPSGRTFDEKLLLDELVSTLLEHIARESPSSAHAQNQHADVGTMNRTEEDGTDQKHFVGSRRTRIRDRCTATTCTSAALGENGSLSDLEEKIMFMEVAGKDDGGIRESLKEIYGIDLPVSKISSIIRTVHTRIQQWQNRELEKAYPVIHFDGIQPAVTRFGTIGRRSSYIAVAISFNGTKEVLGIWTTTGSLVELQHRILSELRQRGVQDIFLAFADRSREFCEAFSRHYPRTRVHAGIAGLIRDSLHPIPSLKRVQMRKDLKNLYQAADQEAALAQLSELQAQWSSTSPAFTHYWKDQWEMFAPLCSCPIEVRKVIFMLNVIESLNSALRKVMRNRRLFRSEEVLFRVLFLTLHSVAMKWPRSLRDWKTAYSWLAVTFGDRMPTK